MRKFLKSLVCLLTAIVIFSFSVVSVPASADITYEQDIINYSHSQGAQQGIPFLPNHFFNLYGFSTVKPGWDVFVKNSIYPNRFYYSIISGSYSKNLYIINYDYIVYYNENEIRFNKCIGFSFYSYISQSGEEILNTNNSYFGNYNTSAEYYQISFYPDSSLYYQFSFDDSSLVLSDGSILYESLDENKETGIAKGLGALLSGGFSLMDNSLVDVNADDFNLLGSLVSGQIATDLSASLGVGVEVGDDTYNEIVTDLTNNTTNSNYWSQMDNSTKTNINNIYSNLKNSFDNSVKVYNNDAGDYYYQPVTTTSNNTNYPNFSNYVSNGGDIAEYFNNYIKTNVSNSTGDGGGDVTTGNGGSSSSGDGGAYAEANANAEGGNASIGDININIPSSSGDGDSSSSGSSSDSSQDFDDVDTSTLESLLNSCNNFIDWVGKVLSVFPAEIIGCFTALLSVVVVCRILGR